MGRLKDGRATTSLGAPLTREDRRDVDKLLIDIRLDGYYGHHGYDMFGDGESDGFSGGPAMGRH